MSPPLPGHPQLELARPKVLVVDHALDHLEALGSILESAGIDVLAAPSGEVALHIVGEIDVDLVLLDTLLPVMDGLTLCKRLRELSGSALPVIFISAKGDTNTLVEAFSAGGVDYITKPVQRGEVLARVGKHLELARRSRELSRQNRELTELNRKLAEQIERRRSSLGAEPPSTLNLSVVKERLISQALAQTQGNVTAAARILGVHRSWFYRRKVP